MPKAAEKKIKKQGGAVRWRMKKLKDGSKMRCAITKKKGPSGGRTVCYKV